MKKKLTTAVITILIAVASLIFYKVSDKQAEPAVSPDNTSFSAHFVDVGQGDSTLITCDGEAMLVDGGTGDAEDDLIQYLKNQGITTLKYVIATHPHEDHIGGLDAVLEEFEVKDIIMPDATSSSMAFERLLNNIEKEGLEITVPAVGDTYTLGSASFTVLSPDKEYDDLNDSSIVFKMTYKSKSLLFTGDVGAEPIDILLKDNFDLSADIYKVAHHGSAKNNPEDFIEAISPSYAVISCAFNNSYGHPHDEVIDRLTAVEADIYRTDTMGTVIIHINNESISIKTDK